MKYNSIGIKFLVAFITFGVINISATVGSFARRCEPKVKAKPKVESCKDAKDSNSKNNSQGYDRQGYDRQGYDRQGYDREGYDREGYDREGYDREGYDREGYDREGYDREGYDREGYDREGYDREGYDREGYDRKGYDRKGCDRKGKDKNGKDKNGKDKNDKCKDSSYDISDDSKGAWGDPHFDIKIGGGKHIKFDHKGINGNWYRIFTGDNFDIIGKYAPWNGALPQIIDTTKIKAGSDLIIFNASGKATLNGKDIKVGTYVLKDGTVVEFKSAAQMKLISPEKDSNVTIYCRSGKYQDIDPSGKFNKLGGIIGKAIKEGRALTNAECDMFNVK
jgi:hypothetical protein